MAKSKNKQAVEVQTKFEPDLHHRPVSTGHSRNMEPMVFLIYSGSLVRRHRPPRAVTIDFGPPDSSDTVDAYPQSGMGYPGVLPPLTTFRTVGHVIASIGLAMVIAVLAFC